jgi:hypothetical protein
MTVLGNYNNASSLPRRVPYPFFDDSARLGRNTLQVLDRACIRFYNAVSRLANHKLGYFCLHPGEFAGSSE